MPGSNHRKAQAKATTAAASRGPKTRAVAPPRPCATTATVASPGPLIAPPTSLCAAPRLDDASDKAHKVTVPIAPALAEPKQQPLPPLVVVPSVGTAATETKEPSVLDQRPQESSALVIPARAKKKITATATTAHDLYGASDRAASDASGEERVVTAAIMPFAVELKKKASPPFLTVGPVTRAAGKKKITSDEDCAVASGAKPKQQASPVLLPERMVPRAPAKQKRKTTTPASSFKPKVQIETKVAASKAAVVAEEKPCEPEILKSATTSELAASIELEPVIVNSATARESAAKIKTGEPIELGKRAREPSELELEFPASANKKTKPKTQSAPSSPYASSRDQEIATMKLANRQLTEHLAVANAELLVLLQEREQVKMRVAAEELARAEAQDAATALNMLPLVGTGANNVELPLPSAHVAHKLFNVLELSQVDWQHGVVVSPLDPFEQLDAIRDFVDAPSSVAEDEDFVVDIGDWPMAAAP